MDLRYKTLGEFVKAGPAQLCPGLIVALSDARTGRVVQMPKGWQLRDHENISITWTDAIPDAAQFLESVNNFAQTLTDEFTSAQIQSTLGSRLPHSGAVKSKSTGDTTMAQKDLDEATAGLKAAKKPGAYNGPGIAPNRNVAPTSVPLKTAKPATGNVKAPKTTAPKSATAKSATAKGAPAKSAPTKVAAPKSAPTKGAPTEEKKTRTPQVPRDSAAAMFKQLILEGKLDDDKIFAAVASKFGLDAKKRSYVAWYRNNLHKKGLL